MTNANDVEFLEHSDESDDLDFSKFPDDLASVTMHGLCDIVITYRYLGMFKEYALSCMKELARRRTEGDDFDFETYIDAELSKLPKIDLKLNILAGMDRVK